VSGSQVTAVVLDPSEEVADILGRIEDWLLFAEPDDPADAATLAHAAQLAGALGSLLRDATETVTDLHSPDGRVQLAPLVAIHADLSGAVAAVHRALLALPHDQPPPGTFPVLDLLHRCGLCSRSEDGAVLAATARSGPGTLYLDARQYRAYQRFACLGLVDPLDRFIALPYASPLGSREVSPHSPGPELEL
jgi:hypothetical protein